MDKKHEIEIKLIYKNKKQVIDKIISLGAKFKEKYLLNDIYFGFSMDMSNKNKLVRIRKKNDFCELTFKGEAEDKNHIWKRVEINTEIRDASKIAEILVNLGLMKIKENLSNREAYLLRGLEIVFQNYEIPAKLSLIEVEGDEEEINWLLGELGSLVERAGENLFKKFDKQT